MPTRGGPPPSVAFAAGLAAATGARALLPRLLLVKFRRDLRALNAGDYGPLLANFAEDAVLHFNEGPHRWSGTHRGRVAIEGFLQRFTDAGLKGELGEILVAGPPWRLTIAARFDDHALGPAGEVLYRNRVVLLVRMRWGRIVEQDDFFEDTVRISAFEARLRAR